MRIRPLITTLAVAAIPAAADEVTLHVNLDDHPSGTYQLTGQSAMFATMTGSVTTGGQLDGIVSGAADIGYTEVFPPPTLADYLTFGYFGRILTLDGLGGVTDTSMVVAMQPGTGVGLTIDAIFGGDDEATLVAALASNDSPEFFDFLDAALANGAAQGAIAVPPIGRPGDTLDLIAFIGGPNGDQGVKVGDFTFTVVPAPAAAAALLLAAAGRRRRA